MKTGRGTTPNASGAGLPGTTSAVFSHGHMATSAPNNMGDAILYAALTCLKVAGVAAGQDKAMLEARGYALFAYMAGANKDESMGLWQQLVGSATIFVEQTLPKVEQLAATIQAACADGGRADAFLTAMKTLYTATAGLIKAHPNQAQTALGDTFSDATIKGALGAVALGDEGKRAVLAMLQFFTADEHGSTKAIGAIGDMDSAIDAFAGEFNHFFSNSAELFICNVTPLAQLIAEFRPIKKIDEDGSVSSDPESIPAGWNDNALVVRSVTRAISDITGAPANAEAVARALFGGNFITDDYNDSTRAAYHSIKVVNKVLFANIHPKSSMFPDELIARINATEKLFDLSGGDGTYVLNTAEKAGTFGQAFAALLKAGLDFDDPSKFATTGTFDKVAAKGAAIALHGFILQYYSYKALEIQTGAKIGAGSKEFNPSRKYTITMEQIANAVRRLYTILK
jgi:hypothetical protein